MLRHEEENEDDDHHHHHVELYEEFMNAARYGELESVAAIFPLIKEGVDLSLPLGALSALHMAAGNGHIEIVKYLIEHGQNMNIVNSEGNTPLHWAALNGHLEVIRFLVEKGASVSIKNEHGKTAAYEAQRAQHEDIVNLLIEASFMDERPEAGTDSHEKEQEQEQEECM